MAKTKIESDNEKHDVNHVKWNNLIEAVKVALEDSLSHGGGRTTRTLSDGCSASGFAIVQIIARGWTVLGRATVAGM